MKTFTEQAAAAAPPVSTGAGGRDDFAPRAASHCEEVRSRRSHSGRPSPSRSRARRRPSMQSRTGTAQPDTSTASPSRATASIPNYRGEGPGQHRQSLDRGQRRHRDRRAIRQDQQHRLLDRRHGRHRRRHSVRPEELLQLRRIRRRQHGGCGSVRQGQQCFAYHPVRQLRNGHRRAGRPQ